MSNSPPRSRISRNIGLVSSVLGGISVISLIGSGFQVGWAEPLRQILDQYVFITNNIRHIVEPYVVPFLRAIANFLTIDFSLGPNWTDILLLMMIYLGSRLKAYVSDTKYVRATFMLAISVAICLTCSCLGSSTDLKGWQDAFRSSCVPLLGFLVYDLIYACLGAALDRRERVSWWEDFLRHLWFSMPLLVLCAATNLALAIIFVQVLGASGYQAYILVFIVNYVLISVYWGGKALQHARKSENRNLGESIRERYWRSSATSVSLNVAVVVISAAAFMLSNAGLKATGAEFSYFNRSHS